ncbi:hypothetical protein [Bacillus sp. CHD6a]|uniref:hypothetical protein n=1 Tax=Bacillus sp. CHD6a TaxID=1643452 RepID=UPI0006CDE1F4|nr:hypothetical protein [Bacillus sp. CHD6a]KPB06242.1 hypothetical protein AAV98_00025 [Bacillus sp. CHD6a]
MFSKKKRSKKYRYVELFLTCIMFIVAIMLLELPKFTLVIVGVVLLLQILKIETKYPKKKQKAIKLKAFVFFFINSNFAQIVVSVIRTCSLLHIIYYSQFLIQESGALIEVHFTSSLEFKSSWKGRFFGETKKSPISQLQLREIELFYI